MEKEKLTTLTVTVPKHVKAQVRDFATKREWSLAKAGCRLLEKALKAEADSAKAA